MLEHLLRLHNNLRRLEKLRAGPIGEVESLEIMEEYFS